MAANDILTSLSLSPQEIELSINDYLDSLASSSLIQDNFPASTRTILVKLLSGYAANLLFNFHQLRGETYLSTAILPSSICAISSMLGYNINRSKAPKLSIRYLRDETIHISRGDVLGFYGEYELVYFGEMKQIEKYDIITVYIGKYKEYTDYVTLSSDGSFILQISPDVYKSVEHDLFKFYLNSQEATISKEIEEYVIYNYVVDFSDSPDSLKLFISDTVRQYGLSVIPNDNYTVKYLETDGMIEKLDLTKFDFEDNYEFVEYLSPGSSGDSLEKIRYLAPFYYSTLRRGVTEKDYKFLTEATPYINNAECITDNGTPGIYEISILNILADTTYTVRIREADYSFVSTASSTLDDILTGLYNKLKYNSYLVVEKVSTDKLRITTKNAKFPLNSLVSGELLMEEVQINVPPTCCNAYIYYIREGVYDQPIVLTPDEQSWMVTYYKKVKLVGLTISLIPGQVQYFDLNFRIGIKKADYEPKVTSMIRNILKNMVELKLNQEVNYSQIIAEIPKISFIDSEEEVSPIVRLEPLDEMFILPAKMDIYYKVNNLNIEYYTY